VIVTCLKLHVYPYTGPRKRYLHISKIISIKHVISDVLFFSGKLVQYNFTEHFFQFITKQYRYINIINSKHKLLNYVYHYNDSYYLSNYM